MAIELWSGQVTTSSSITGAGGGVSTASAAVVAGPISGYGGTVTTAGAYTIHTFTGSGTFYVNSAVQNGVIEYLFVGGGGGGGDTNQGAMNAGYDGGGGGAGAYLEYFTANLGFGNSFQGPPIYVNPGDSFTITIGAGGASGSIGGNTTITSTLYNFTLYGGGGGGRGTAPTTNFPATNGGSGGGGGHGVISTTHYYGDGGISIAQFPRQGYTGFAGNASLGTAGNGGGASRTNGITSNTYAVGGRAGYNLGNGISGGSNTGNGGDGAQSWMGSSGYGPFVGGTGGSGIVVIRYRTT